MHKNARMPSFKCILAFCVLHFVTIMFKYPSITQSHVSNALRHCRRIHFILFIYSFIIIIIIVSFNNLVELNHLCSWFLFNFVQIVELNITFVPKRFPFNSILCEKRPACKWWTQNATYSPSIIYGCIYMVTIVYRE